MDDHIFGRKTEVSSRFQYMKYKLLQYVDEDVLILQSTLYSGHVSTLD